jgi:hypothetical protein
MTAIPWIGFHLVSLAAPDADALDAAARAIEGTFGLPLAGAAAPPWERLVFGDGDAPVTLHVQRGVRREVRGGRREAGGEDRVEYALLNVSRGRFDVCGPGAIEALFETLCRLLHADLARTVQHGGWAIVTRAEIEGAIDAMDWLQYFGPRWTAWSEPRQSGSTHVRGRVFEDGAALLRLDVDPFADGWRTRVAAAADLGIALRALPEKVADELESEKRLREVLPPEPRAWRDDEAVERDASRARTARAIEDGLGPDLAGHFHRFYFDGALLDRFAVWFTHYGHDETIAAFRAVARVHRDGGATEAFDTIALEGCVKLVAWSARLGPLAMRELLAEHTIDLPDLGLPRFIRNSWNPDIVAGALKLAYAAIRYCTCGKCGPLQREIERLEKETGS